MFQSVRLTAAPDGGHVMPGLRLPFALTVHNASSIVDRYHITVGGIPADWYDLDQQTVSLFPSVSGTVTLVIHPPAGMATMAGSYPITVEARSEGDPTTKASVVLTLTVGAVGGLSMSVRPTRVEGRAARFRVTILNGSNATAAIQIAMRDDQEGLRFDPEPEGELTVPAGGERVVVVGAVPISKETIGEPHPYLIEVRGVKQGDGGEQDPALVQQAVFTYLPRFTALSLPPWVRRLPTWTLIALLLALLLLLLLAGGGAGAAIATGSARAPKRPPAIPTPPPTASPVGSPSAGPSVPGPLPQIKRFALQADAHGHQELVWAVAGARMCACKEAAWP